MERNKRERTSIKASSHWSRFGLPPILSWTSCKWAFGHSGWAVKWAPHETCCPLHHIMLGIDTEVPCLHWPHSPVSYIWMELCLCPENVQMCTGRMCENKLCCKRKIISSGKLRVDCLHTKVSGRELHRVLECGGERILRMFFWMQLDRECV